MNAYYLLSINVPFGFLVLIYGMSAGFTAAEDCQKDAIAPEYS